jgi:hypothetical protein
MDPDRHSMPEQGAYALLREAVFELSQAERALVIVERAAPDPERARHSAGIRTPAPSSRRSCRPVT